MRLAIVMVIALTACGTRRATITYGALAGASLGLAAVTHATACDGDHSECDRVGPAVMKGVFITSALVFATAALVSAAATPSATPRRTTAPAGPAAAAARSHRDHGGVAIHQRTTGSSTTTRTGVTDRMVSPASHAKTRP